MTERKNGGDRRDLVRCSRSRSVTESGSFFGVVPVPTFAFYIVPEASEPSMSIVEAANFDAAKAQAVLAIKHDKLRAIRLWDGQRVIAVNRPARPVSAKAADDADDRGACMIAMKAEGKTQRQIAAAFEISIDRVRQLMERAQSRVRMHAIQPNRAALSVRARNVLPLLIDESETEPSERDRLLPERVAALNRAQILDAPNAGLRTIAEFEAWLWERGLCLSDEV